MAAAFDALARRVREPRWRLIMKRISHVLQYGVLAAALASSPVFCQGTSGSGTPAGSDSALTGGPTGSGKATPRTPTDAVEAGDARAAGDSSRSARSGGNSGDHNFG